MLPISALCVALAALATGTPQATGEAADLAVVGRVFTGVPEHPAAEALAVRGDRLVYVGTEAGLAPWLGPETRVLRNGSGSVVPGFNDAHCHFTVGFGMTYDVDLFGARSLEEILERVRAFAEAHPDAPLIEGQGWDLADLPGEAWPTAAQLDEACDDRPVLLWSDGPHGVWVNTLAMERAGIFERSEPPNTIFLRDAEGEPTGMFLGRGLFGLFRFTPPPDFESMRAGIRAGLAEASRLGVTSVHESVSPELIPFLAELYDAGELSVRFHVWGSPSPSPFGGGPDEHEALRERHGRRDWITFGTLKSGVDGMPGLRTAALLEPYADDPESTGILALDATWLRGTVEDANARGLRLALHATGDAGVRLAARSFAGERTGVRNRIEHAFLVARADHALLARTGTVVSVQPGFLSIDLEKDLVLYVTRFGEERAHNVLPLRSLLDAGVTLAFGTDFSLTPLDPRVGLAAAVYRTTRGGQPAGGWIPAERITLAEAITAYTLGSAVAEGADEHKGRIAVGALADLVLFADDVFTLDREGLLAAPVRTTIVGGRIVHGE